MKSLLSALSCPMWDYFLTSLIIVFQPLLGTNFFIPLSLFTHEENYCQQLQFTYNGLFWDITITYGGYSYMIVADYRCVVHIPEKLKMEGMASLLYVGITMFSPMKGSQIGGEWGQEDRSGGAGGLGHMVVKFGKVFGHHVTMISRSTGKEWEAKHRLGADEFIVSSEHKQMEGRKRTLDFILDMVSGQHSLLPLLELLKINSTLLIMGALSQPLELPAVPLIFKKKSVKGAIIRAMKETQEMLYLCRKHNITCNTELIRPNQINDAMHRLTNNDVCYHFIIDIASASSYSHPP